MNKKTIEDMHLLASARGIYFRGDEYLGAAVPHLWQCINGHNWYARPSNIKTGYGCPHCFDIKRKAVASESRYDFTHYEKIAKSRGGNLYRVPSIDFDHKIKGTLPIVAECQNGHRWLTTGAILARGCWCGICAINLKVLQSRESLFERAATYASINNGFLVTTRESVLALGSTQDTMKWSCENGHTWKSSLVKMESKGRWCAQCKHGDDTSLEDLKREAILRGGDCLSKEYKTGKDKYLWKCSRGHEWTATWFHVMHSSTWCPKCSKKPRVKEQLCRLVFERVFKVEFPTRRPSWLAGLELDGYSDELGIAFEHQGLQHYVVDGYFNKSQRDLLLIQERDRVKKELCSKANIVLVRIPDIDLRKSNEHIYEGIFEEIKASGIHVTDDLELKREDWKSKAWRSEGYDDLYQKVELSGGKPVGINIISGKANLEYECKCGAKHVSDVSYLLKSPMPGMCPDCRVHELRVPYILSRANFHGWTFLSLVEGDRDRGVFSCKAGHQFTRKVTQIRDNSICPTCYRDRLKEASRLNDQVAKERVEAKKLSKKTVSDKVLEYVSARGGKITAGPSDFDRRYEITCQHGHSWRVLGSSIRTNRTWCPVCAGKAKSSIDEMHEIAKSRGGICLSQEYMGSHTHLLWGCGTCSKTWRAMPTNIKKGTWCPSCKRKGRSGMKHPRTLNVE